MKGKKLKAKSYKLKVSLLVVIHKDLKTNILL
jgi:hypothetical protein